MPMQSLIQANRIILDPGDRMFFKNGSVYNGRFKPKGEGTQASPIYIGTYGDENAPRPQFNGQGKFEEAVLIYNTRYLHLDGIEITNTGPEPEPKRRGLQIQIENYGTAQNIKITNLFIHNVNGSIFKREGGGLTASSSRTVCSKTVLATALTHVAIRTVATGIQA